MSVRYTVVRTASASDAPAAAQTAARFSRQRAACAPALSPTSSPVAGIEWDLTRAEQQAAGGDGVAVGADAAGAESASTILRCEAIERDYLP